MLHDRRLKSQDYSGIQTGNPRDDIREAITQLGLNFRLMTQFTSLVAVEEMTITDGGEPRKIEVPVEMPEGVSHAGVFGESKESDALKVQSAMVQVQSRIGGYASGGGGGGGRVTAASSGALPKAPAPPRASPQPQARSKKDSRAGSATGMGRGSGGGMGGGSGPGTTPSPAQSAPNGGLTLAESLGMTSRADRVSTEEQKRRELLTKMNPSIAAVIERLNNKAQPGADENKFVRNGKAEIQVWLTDKSPETMAQLKRLGFEFVLDPKTAKTIIGRLPIGKLAALVQLKSVRYIAPMTSN